MALLSPVAIDGVFVFCSFENAAFGEHSNLQPMAAIVESEGLTLVIPKSKADAHGLHYETVFKAITLGVHSSLDAVGLTAAVSTKLAAHGISANVIAGYFHDHVLVPLVEFEEAFALLTALQEQVNQEITRH